MLPPSQCDFTGFYDLDLCNVNNVTLPIYAYSAGLAIDDIYLRQCRKKHLDYLLPISLKQNLPFFRINLFFP